MKKCLDFIKKHTVLCIAALAAVITCFIVPPDKEYLGYFDFRTLCCLFMTLAAVCALRDIKFFTIVARKTVKLAGNLRILAIVLTVITFIGSMIIANDMALITFLPIGYFALSVTKQEKHSAYIFIIQNISANLGGMLTPFGNPQNLYLYSKFNIPTGEFMGIMLAPFLLAITMLVVCCLFLPGEKLEIKDDFPDKLNKKRTVIYSVLFALSILCVFRILPSVFGIGAHFICTIIMIAALLFLDREALRSVDYPLLLTFAMFFIFSGNLSRSEAVRSLMSGLLQKSTLLVSALSCQCISNVPSAILLSQFTDNYKELLLGVNIGGTGTLIASLASLITFSEYKLLYPGKTKHYFVLFTVMNFVFLAVMLAVAYFFFI